MFSLPFYVIWINCTVGPFDCLGIEQQDKKKKNINFTGNNWSCEFLYSQSKLAKYSGSETLYTGKKCQMSPEFNENVKRKYYFAE